MANNKAFKIKNGLSATRYLGTNGTETAGTEGYNIAGASYDSVSFSVASQETFLYDVTFKPDGTKMYAIGQGNDTIYEYSLSSAWDISTSVYSGTSFSVGSQNANPSSIAFNSDGTKLFMNGGTGDIVYEYTLSTAYDLTTASYSGNSFSVNAQSIDPANIFFKPDGTKFYITDPVYDTVIEYNMSTAYDLTTASYSGNSFSTTTQDNTPFSTNFNEDGTKMYVAGAATDTIYEYALSTAYSVATASYTGVNFSFSAQETNPRNVKFKPNGSKMYLVGDTTDSIYQYSTALLTQTLDLSTGHTFSFTPSGATTVSFTNPPASGIATAFTVEVNNSAGGYAITWPSSVKWHLGTAPTATASKEVYTFITTDGGTTYYAKLAGSNIA